MPFCLEMLEHGKSCDDAGRIYYLVVESYFRESPPPPDTRSAAQKEDDWGAIARWSREHGADYPGNWVAEYVERVPAPFTHGIDYRRCGNLELCRKWGIPDSANYLCMMDLVTYRARGQGLTRTMTLAEGSDRCDFRFSEDGVIRCLEPFTVARLHEWGEPGE